ncbi:MAG: type II toxin-antitoxin system VapC family toxin [Chloroflexi bacterium]|nr:type II toxin-antitoxin system VapC family toxin [Ardenticatenaceae bacterium]NOG35882.1 type II toxin-antitoxin system VapC family toxin [Chloroflexota bacterium]
MTQGAYLFDTHALIFWANKTSVSAEFIKFFDHQAQQGALHVSSITFWEIALLVQKGRLAIPDIHAWKNELLSQTNIQLINPSATEMIDSTLLPPHHKDPFDRLLLAQAKHNNLILVTRDQLMLTYTVPQIWM